MNKKDYKYALILDEKFNSEEDLNNPKVQEAMEYFKEKSKHNMGIGEPMFYSYVYPKNKSNVDAELKEIENFLKVFIKIYSIKHQREVEDYSLEFINYGKMELVYVLVDEVDGSKVTILVKQPSVEHGKLSSEFIMLQKLHKEDDMVVCPIDYFSYEGQELYVTPYIEQARCISYQGKLGSYIPEPYYRFETFDEERVSVVNQCMIAKLISFYDDFFESGISKVRISSGDFMLKKGWEEMEPTIENTLNSLYFIAVRDTVNCSFEEYIEIIRKEFSRATINENNDYVTINCNAHIPMSSEDVEKGIELGRVLYNNKLAIRETEME